MRRQFADPDTGVFTDSQHSVSYVIIIISNVLHDSNHCTLGISLWVT